jgi:zinc/manganese transport system substrate-binding protein
VLEPFTLPFVQRGIVEVLLLAVPAGLLGTWIVLRGLAFFSHAVGTAAFPGLVVADGLGFAAPLGALGAAAAFAVCVLALRGRRSGQDAIVALVLTAALAGGVLLASDVFGSGANVETLLFGSLLLIDSGEIAFAATVAAATVAANALLAQRWLTTGFDPLLPSPGGPGPRALDAALFGLLALATSAALTVVGALLAAALFVVPAATARLLTDRLRPWQLLSVGLVAAEGVLGLWLSVKLNAPPGATIAVVSGAAFAIVALARALRPESGGRAAVAIAAAVLAGGVLAGCGDSGSGSRAGVQAVATTTQVGDIVGQVGGDAVDVDQLLQPNSDPHEYEPRPDDVVAVSEADLVFSSGAGLDAWIGEVVDDAGSDAEVVDLAAGEEPHWWQDPRNAAAAAREIGRALSVADPERRRAFARNADAYVSRLRALDAEIAACMRSIPSARRRIVTDHDAFGPFAERYGIEVVGTVIPSQTTEAQPSAMDLSELIELIEDEDVRAVLPEASLSPAVAEAVARQTGANARYTLYGDALGPEGSSGATYTGMLAANADAVVRAITDGRRGCTPSR